MKNENELFQSTRKHLAKSNSWMLIIFLVLFIVITCCVLFSVIYNEQKRELESLTIQEMEEVRSTNLENSPAYPKDQEKPQIEGDYQGIYLNYFLKPNGELMIGDEFLPRLRPLILERIRGWNSSKMVIRQEEFQLSEQADIHVLLAAQSVYNQGKYIGTIYIGKDITFLWVMFKWLLIVLGGMLIIFIFVAIVIGQFLTRRAMKPIIQAYTRQREFVADASHELRTPLSIIKTGLEVFEMEEKEKLSSLSGKLLDDLKDEVSRIIKLVGDLLTLARTDSGEQQISCHTFDFSSLAEQVFRSCQALASDQQILLKCHIQSNLFIFADQNRIKQLLYILLDNAIKYTSSGGEVTLSCISKEMDHRQTLCISVRDTGIGIEAQQLERIFDRFYRVDKTRSRKISGTGLGLAIGKWIVESHSGSIDVSSIPGSGSTFTVYLPIRKE